MSEGLCEAFVAVAEMAQALGIKPLNQHDGCWTFQVDDQWWIAVNGHKEPKPARSPQGASKDEPFMVDPFHAYIEFNGWPAGVINPRGGTIAAGAVANEDAFIAALRASTSTTAKKT